MHYMLIPTSDTKIYKQLFLISSYFYMFRPMTVIFIGRNTYKNYYKIINSYMFV